MYQVWVTYIDFGNEEKVAIKDLRNMQDRFMLYPEFRVHCSLSDILPLDENNTWDLVTVQEFAKLTENKVRFFSTCIYFCKLKKNVYIRLLKTYLCAFKEKSFVFHAYWVLKLNK